MTTTHPHLVDVRPMAQQDEPGVLDLLSTSLAGGPTGERTSDFLRWKHQDNPFGQSLALVAESDGRLVGLRMFMRWEFRLHGRPVTAVRAVDTATHPDFRGRGLFRTLTLAALDEVRATTELVFNTPNAQSRPGYLKMGWVPVGQVPILIRPVRWARFARGICTTTTTPVGAAAVPPVVCSLPRAADIFTDPRLAELVASAAEAEHAARLATPRTVDYLRWRYAEAPGLDYRAVPVERGGELVGVGFGRPRTRGSLSEFTLSEVIVRGGDTRSAGRVLAAAAADSRCDHVATHCAAGSAPARVALRHGYFQAPRSGMGLVTNVLRPIDPDPRNLSAWRLSLGDLEVF